MHINLIAAMTADRVIGNNNQLPWHLPVDLAYFKQTTLGKPVIMGRKTFDSIGKALPKRRNIIVTRQQDFSAANCEVAHSLSAALALVAGEPEVFIVGGAILYQSALAKADFLYITWVDADIAGDAFFPAFDRNNWQEISSNTHPADEDNQYRCRFVVLKRK